MDTLIPPKTAETNSRLIYGDGTDRATWQAWAGIEELSSLKLDPDFIHANRVVIVAPHPDDEIMGCAGLMQQLSALGKQIVLVAVTNGTASHPDSKCYTPEGLNQLRPQETQAALKVLGIDNIDVIALNIQDDAVSQNLDIFYQLLMAHVQAEDVLVTTFHKDGHPDHEFTAQVVNRVAQEKKLKYFEVLIWAWHWAHPNDPQIPWDQARRLDLTAQQLQLKQRAIQCFASQIHIDESTGKPAILSEKTIDRILMPFEVYIHVQ